MNAAEENKTTPTPTEQQVAALAKLAAQIPFEAEPASYQNAQEQQAQ